MATDWMWCYENPKEAAAEIERLTDRCAAYKGQVECGAIEIERLLAVAARAYNCLGDTTFAAETRCQYAHDFLAEILVQQQPPE